MSSSQRLKPQRSFILVVQPKSAMGNIIALSGRGLEVQGNLFGSELQSEPRIPLISVERHLRLTTPSLFSPPSCGASKWKRASSTAMNLMINSSKSVLLVHHEAHLASTPWLRSFHSTPQKRQQNGTLCVEHLVKHNLTTECCPPCRSVLVFVTTQTDAIEAALLSMALWGRVAGPSE